MGGDLQGEELDEDKSDDKGAEDVGGNEVPTSVHTSQAAVRQPPGECDPESDLPCSCPRRSFADPPEQLPMPETKSITPASEGRDSRSRLSFETLGTETLGLILVSL